MTGHAKRVLALLSIIGAAMVVAVGCGSSNEGGGGDSKKLAADQIFTLNIGGDVSEGDALDPAFSSYTETYNINNALFATLFRIVGEDSELVPWLAAELPKVSDDGLTYTVSLREDAKWSDGTPITSEDVVYGLRRSLSPETGAFYSSLFFNVVGACEYYTSKSPKAEATDTCGALKTDGSAEAVGVKALDEYTVEYTLEQQIPWFDQLLSLQIAAPQPQKAIEKHGDRWVDPGNSVSSGAFVLAEYKPGSRIVLKKNPEWWGADDVTLDQIVMKMIGDPQTAAKEFENEKFDASWTGVSIPPAQIDKWKDKEEYFSVLSAVTNYLWFNTTNKSVSDPKIRQGLSVAIDRQSIVDNVTRKGDVPLTINIPNVIPGYDTIKEGAQDFVTETADVDKAKDLLAQGGWKDGTELSLYYNSESPTAPALSEAIQSDLSKVGAKVKLVPVSSSQLGSEGIGITPGKKVDMVLQGWAADYPDAQTYYQQFTCGALTTQLSSSNFCDKDFDELYDEAVATVDEDARIELYKQIEAMLTGPDGLMPGAPLYQVADNTLIHTWVDGYEPLPSALVYYEDVKIYEH